MRISRFVVQCGDIGVKNRYGLNRSSRCDIEIVATDSHNRPDDLLPVGVSNLDLLADTPGRNLLPDLIGIQWFCRSQNDAIAKQNQSQRYCDATQEA